MDVVQEGDSMSSPPSKKEDIITSRNELNQSLSNREQTFDVELNVGTVEENFEESEISTVSEASTPRQTKKKKRNRWRRNRKRTNINDAETCQTGASQTASNEMLDSTDKPSVITTYVCSSTELDKVSKLIDNKDPVIEMPEMFKICEACKPLPQQLEFEARIPTENENLVPQLDEILTGDGDTNEIDNMSLQGDNIVELEEPANAGADVPGSHDEESISLDSSHASASQNNAVSLLINSDESHRGDNYLGHSYQQSPSAQDVSDNDCEKTHSMTDEALQETPLQEVPDNYKTENVSNKNSESSQVENADENLICFDSVTKIITLSDQVEDLEKMPNVDEEMIISDENSALKKSITACTFVADLGPNENADEFIEATSTQSLPDPKQQTVEMSETENSEYSLSSNTTTTDNSILTEGYKKYGQSRKSKRSKKKSKATENFQLDKNEHILLKGSETDSDAAKTEGKVIEIDVLSVQDGISHNRYVSEHSNEGFSKKGLDDALAAIVGIPLAELDQETLLLKDNINIGYKSEADEDRTDYADSRSPVVVSELKSNHLFTLEPEIKTDFRDKNSTISGIIENTALENEYGGKFSETIIADEKLLISTTDVINESEDFLNTKVESDLIADSLKEPEWIASLLKDDEKKEGTDQLLTIDFSTDEREPVDSAPSWQDETTPCNLDSISGLNPIDENVRDTQVKDAEYQSPRNEELEVITAKTELFEDQRSVSLSVDVSYENTIALVESLETRSDYTITASTKNDDDSSALKGVGKDAVKAIVVNNEVLSGNNDELILPHNFDTDEDLSTKTDTSGKSAKSTKTEKSVTIVKSNVSVASERSIKLTSCDDSIVSSTSHTSIKSHSSVSQKLSTQDAEASTAKSIHMIVDATMHNDKDELDGNANYQVVDVMESNIEEIEAAEISPKLTPCEFNDLSEYSKYSRCESIQSAKEDAENQEEKHEKSEMSEKSEKCQKSEISEKSEKSKQSESPVRSSKSGEDISAKSVRHDESLIEDPEKEDEVDEIQDISLQSDISKKSASEVSIASKTSEKSKSQNSHLFINNSMSLLSESDLLDKKPVNFQEDTLSKKSAQNLDVENKLLVINERLEQFKESKIIEIENTEIETEDEAAEIENISVCSDTLHLNLKLSVKSEKSNISLKSCTSTASDTKDVVEVANVSEILLGNPEDLSEKSEFSITSRAASESVASVKSKSCTSIKSATSGVSHFQKSDDSNNSEKSHHSRMSAEFPTSSNFKPEKQAKSNPKDKNDKDSGSADKFLCPFSEGEIESFHTSNAASKKSSSNQICDSERKPSITSNVEHANLPGPDTSEPNTEDEAEEINESLVRADVWQKSGSDGAASSKPTDANINQSSMTSASRRSSQLNVDSNLNTDLDLNDIHDTQSDKSTTSEKSLTGFEFSPASKNPSVSSLHQLSQKSSTSRKSQTSAPLSNKSSASELDELLQVSDASRKSDPLSLKPKHSPTLIKSSASQLQELLQTSKKSVLCKKSDADLPFTLQYSVSQKFSASEIIENPQNSKEILEVPKQEFAVSVSGIEYRPEKFKNELQDCDIDLDVSVKSSYSEQTNVKPSGSKQFVCDFPVDLHEIESPIVLKKSLSEVSKNSNSKRNSKVFEVQEDTDDEVDEIDDISVRTDNSGKSNFSQKSDANDAFKNSEASNKSITSIKSSKSNNSDISVKSAMSKTFDTSMKSSKSNKFDVDVSIKSAKSDVSIKSAKSDVSIKSAKSDVSIKSAKSDVSIKSAKSDVSIKSKKSDVSIKSEKSDVSTKSKKSDASIKSAISNQSNVSTKSAKSNKYDVSIKSAKPNKSDVSMKSDTSRNLETEVLVNSEMFRKSETTVKSEITYESDISGKSETPIKSDVSSKSETSIKCDLSKKSETSITFDVSRKSETSIKSNLSNKSETFIKSELSKKSDTSIKPTLFNKSETFIKSDLSRKSESETSIKSDFCRKSETSIKSNVSRKSETCNKSDDSRKSESEMSIKSHVSRKSETSIKSNVSRKSETSIKSDVSKKSETSIKSNVSRKSETCNKSDDSRKSESETSIKSHVSRKSETSIKSDVCRKSEASIKSNVSRKTETCYKSDDSRKSESEASIKCGVSKKSETSIKSHVSKKSETSIKSDVSKHSETSIKVDVSKHSETSIKSDVCRKSEASIKSDVSKKSETSIKSDVSRKSETSIKLDVSRKSEISDVSRKSDAFENSASAKQSENYVSKISTYSKKSDTSLKINASDSKLSLSTNKPQLSFSRDLEDFIKQETIDSLHILESNENNHNQDTSLSAASTASSVRTKSVSKSASKSSIKNSDLQITKSKSKSKPSSDGKNQSHSKQFCNGDESKVEVDKSQQLKQKSQSISKLSESIASHEGTDTENEVDEIPEIQEFPEIQESTFLTSINLGQSIDCDPEQDYSADVASKSSVNVIYKVGAASFPNRLQSLTSVDAANGNHINIDPISGLPDEPVPGPGSDCIQYSMEEMKKYEPSTEPSLGELWMAGDPTEGEGLTNSRLNPSLELEATATRTTYPESPLGNTDDSKSEFKTSFLSDNQFQEHEHHHTATESTLAPLEPPHCQIEKSKSIIAAESSVATDHLDDTVFDYEYKLLDVPNPSVENRDGLVNLDLIVPPPQLHPHSLTRIALVKRENPKLVNMARTAVDNILDTAQQIMARTYLTGEMDTNTVVTDAEDVILRISPKDANETNTCLDASLAEGYNNKEAESELSTPFTDTKIAYEYHNLNNDSICNDISVSLPGVTLPEEMTEQEKEEQQWNDLVIISDMQETQLLEELERQPLLCSPSPPSYPQVSVVLSSNKSTGVNLSVSSSITSLESNEVFKLPKVPNPSMEDQHGLGHVSVQPLDIDSSSFARLVTHSMRTVERKDAFCEGHQQLDLPPIPKSQPGPPASRQHISGAISNASSTVQDLTSDVLASTSDVTLCNRLPIVPLDLLDNFDFGSTKDDLLDIAQDSDNNNISGASSTEKLVGDTEKKMMEAFVTSRQGISESLPTEPEPQSLPEPPGWIIDPKVIEDALTESEITDNNDPGRTSFIQSIFNCFGKKNRTKKAKVDPLVSPRDRVATTPATTTASKTVPNTDKDKPPSRFKTFSLSRKKNRGQQQQH